MTTPSQAEKMDEQAFEDFRFWGVWPDHKPQHLSTSVKESHELRELRKGGGK